MARSSYEAITVSTAAIGLTAAKYAGKASCLITNESGADVRWTVDGTAPTAGTIGHLLPASKAMVLEGQDLMKNFLAIRNAGADATLKVSFFRTGSAYPVAQA